MYKEIVIYAKELNKEVSPLDYLIWGGFPKRFDMPNEESIIRYLKDLEDTIVIKDLIKRYKIKITKKTMLN